MFDKARWSQDRYTARKEIKMVTQDDFGTVTASWIKLMCETWPHKIKIKQKHKTKTQNKN